VQEFFTFSAEKGPSAKKSCIIAGFRSNRSKNGNNDVFSHHFLEPADEMNKQKGDKIN